MDVREALADLMEVSSQVEDAIVLDGSGRLVGASTADGARAESLAGTVRRLLEAAGELRRAAAISRLAATTDTGGLVIVREGERVIAATTPPAPTLGLAFYDLRTALRAIAGGDDAAA